MTYSIQITPAALRMIEEISDRRVRQKIIETIDRLAEDPQKHGKPLHGPYAGFRSLRAVGQRYRIVYIVREQQVVVIVVGVGLRREGDRKDIYQRLRKLIRLKLV